MSDSTPKTATGGSVHRWKVLGATFLTYFYDSYDLAILAVAMPILIKILNIDLAHGGFLASATMIGAAFGSMIFGLIAENYGRRLAIVLSLIEFGIGTGLVYFVTSWEGWMVLRFITGIGIGGVWGPCVALLAQHWAPRYMARANSFMLSTFAIGWIVASLIGRLIFTYDWRLLFLFGATSIIVAAYAWVAIPADSREIGGDARPADKKIGLGVIFEKTVARRTILATIQNACQMGGFWGAATWIPTYLVRERGLEMTSMASFLMLMYIGMFIGYQLFGYIGDNLGRRNAIALCFVIDCITVPTYLLITDASFLFMFGPVMGMAFGGVYGLTGSFYAELFPQNIRALAGGFCFNVGRMGAVIAPFTVGYIGQVYGLKAGIIASPVIFAIGLIVTGFLPETLKKNGDKTVAG
ncbi:MAG: MFS transporter [Negativicutes bacterium]|nr:MFS transporter [Negativicutes bacterium]